MNWIVKDLETNRPYLQMSWDTRQKAEAMRADLIRYALGYWRQRLSVQEIEESLSPPLAVSEKLSSSKFRGSYKKRSK